MYVYNFFTCLKKTTFYLNSYILFEAINSYRYTLKLYKIFGTNAESDATYTHLLEALHIILPLPHDHMQAAIMITCSCVIKLTHFIHLSLHMCFPLPPIHIHNFVWMKKMGRHFYIKIIMNFKWLREIKRNLEK